MLAEFNARNAESLIKLRDEIGVQFRRFNDDMLNTVGTVAGEVVREVGQTDALSGRILESFLDFRRQSMAWSRVADQGFWASRLLPFDY